MEIQTFKASHWVDPRKKEAVEIQNVGAHEETEPTGPEGPRPEDVNSTGSDGLGPHKGVPGRRGVRIGRGQYAPSPEHAQTQRPDELARRRIQRSKGGFFRQPTNVLTLVSVL